ncbi:MAG: 1-phosphofructokinase [Rhodospirillales bacterium 69-11]|nr:1-phosphofructokinase family hexose kinase [Rhodospirillales bacterium]OJW26822.1 MAG: 1-phosphofructokinase [Rhodospirillales bacterium 69-11]
MSNRIITLTLNPAIDLACSAESVRPTHKIRTGEEHIDPGGGGINVARVLHALGADTLAVILAGGVTGALIEDLLNEAGVPHRTVRMRGRTRISFNVFDRTAGVEYRFVPEGPTAEPHDWQATLDLLHRLQGDWVVASGSLEHGMPPDIYAQVARLARSRGQRVAVDTSGTPLALALDAGLDVIKPSLGEFEALVGRKLPTETAQEQAALELIHAGRAQAVAVSKGEEGAFLASARGVVHMPAVPVPFRSAVGAGDSFLAALVLSLAQGKSDRAALAWAVAAGTAAVVCAGTARVTRVEVEAQLRRLAERADIGE